MKGKIVSLQGRKARRERAVYQAAIDAMNQAGVNEAEGVAIMLHVAVALADGMAGTGAQLRLMQRAMEGELDRAVTRAIASRRQDDDPAASQPFWHRWLFALRLRYGLRWRA